MKIGPENLRPIILKGCSKEHFFKGTIRHDAPKTHANARFLQRNPQCAMAASNAFQRAVWNHHLPPAEAAEVKDDQYAYNNCRRVLLPLRK